MKITNGFKVALALVMLAGSMTAHVPAALAQTPEADEAKLRVNLAGRQRMLSQRIVKSACFISMGVDMDGQRAVLKSTMDTFTNTSKALQIGDETLGLSLENNPAILVGLAKVDEDWASLLPDLQALLDGGSVDAATLAKIDADGLTLLEHMNETVGVISSKYGAKLKALPSMLAMTINLAGRQRMLTQKAAKEACLAGAGVDPQKNVENLAGTLSVFNATLDALINGYEGTVTPPPNDEIRAKLQEVNELWQPVNMVLTNITNGKPVSDADKQTVAQGVDRVLDAMNAAVGMYDHATISQ